VCPHLHLHAHVELRRSAISSFNKAQRMPTDRKLGPGRAGARTSVRPVEAGSRSAGVTSLVGAGATAGAVAADVLP